MTGQRPRRTRPSPPRTVWDDALYRFDQGGTPETGGQFSTCMLSHLSPGPHRGKQSYRRPCPYQWLSRGVQLVFGASQQKILSQDVESLPASLGAVVHLCFPQLVLIKRSAAQEPAEQAAQGLDRSNDSIMWFVDTYFRCFVWIYKIVHPQCHLVAVMSTHIQIE